MRVMVSRSTDLSRFQSAASGALGVPVGPVATVHCSVTALPALGEPGKVIAQSVASKVEQDRDQLETWFKVSVPHFDIVVAPLSSTFDGMGGAFHAQCAATTLYCDAKLVPSIYPDRTGALAVAEMVEVYEAVQARGWDCGRSHGEALSRVLAAERYPGVMDDYAVASAWLNSYRPDYVNVTAPTDLDTLSTACGVIFLNYLHYVLKYSWAQICQSAGPTLTDTYRALTGDTQDPFPRVRSLLESKYPPTQHSDLPSDNPW
jgi:hypothetical protein